jgi:hypothetical protein
VGVWEFEENEKVLISTCTSFLVNSYSKMVSEAIVQRGREKRVLQVRMICSLPLASFETIEQLIT